MDTTTKFAINSLDLFSNFCYMQKRTDRSRKLQQMLDRMPSAIGISAA